MFVEFDKAGAEWVLVAYLSGEQQMIDVVETGKSPHVVTGSLISRAPQELIEKEEKFLKGQSNPDTIEELRKKHVPELFSSGYFLSRVMTIRQMGKKSNHALNYDMGYRRFALENEMEEKEASKIVDLYKTQAYPGIKTWHAEVREQLRENRTLVNLLGRSYEFKDAWGDDLFRLAYSYVPQSTVADIIFKAKIAIWKSKKLGKNWELLVQVHDSILLQYLGDSLGELVEGIRLIEGMLDIPLKARGRSFTIKTEVKLGLAWSKMSGFIPPKKDKDLQKEIKTLCGKLNVKTLSR